MKYDAQWLLTEDSAGMVFDIDDLDELTTDR